MTLIRLFCVIVVFLGCLFSAHAQKKYDFSTGLRLGLLDAGLSAKGFVSESVALEAAVMIPLSWGSADGWWTSVTAVGLAEYHFSVSEVSSFNFILGGGWYVSIPTGVDTIPYRQRLYTGPSAILGLEYTFPKAPLSLQFDAIPTYFIGSGLNMDLAFCLRYTFVSKKDDL